MTTIIKPFYLSNCLFGFAIINTNLRSDEQFSKMESRSQIRTSHVRVVPLNAGWYNINQGQGKASSIQNFHPYNFFFFNDTATPKIYTLSLHDALPILERPVWDTETVQKAFDEVFSAHLENYGL